MHDPSRSAISRADFLVVLMMLGIGVGLLGPAVLRVQSQAAHSSKLNNLRQVGAAFLTYQDREMTFPSNRGAIGADEVDDDRLEANGLAVNYYAAIAYSFGTGKWGNAYNYTTRAEAERVALSKCGKSDCEVLAWARNACCALAVGDDSKYGYGWDSDRSSAERRALAECRKRTTNCEIISWACTDR
jgi:type II secretory pathway pseudopilin PulG